MAKKSCPDKPDEIAVIYARYSSHAQNDASIEQQVAECMAYAASNHLRVAATYEDRAMSGRSDKRPEFQKMMRAAEGRKFQAVLAYKSNRISRNMLHALAYEDKLAQFGVRVIYAKEEFGDNAAGRFALRTMMNVNQFYSENMAEDIRRGLKDGAAQCRVIAALPLGYCKGPDGRYQIDGKTAPIVREIFRRVCDGDTLAAIAADLNARGLSTARGKQWGKSSFRTILSNERYVGVYAYDDIRVENGIPAIIEKEVFDTVQNVVKKNASTIRGRRRENGEYLLTGKLFCGYCGSPMVGVSGTGEHGELHHYYACRKRRFEKACHKKNVRRDSIETLVAEALKMYVLQDDTIEWLADMVMDYARLFRAEDTQIDYLTAKLAESKKASANIMRAIEAGIFNDQTQARMLELENEQRDLSAKLAAEKALVPDVTREQIIYWMQSFKGGRIDNAAFRKKLFDAFLVAVYLYDDHLRLVFNWDQNKTPLELPISSWSDDPGQDTFDGDAPNASPSNKVRIARPLVHHTALIRTSITIRMMGRLFVVAFSFDPK